MLLIAAVGVASVTYVAIACDPLSLDNPPTVGNLPAPIGQVDSGPPPTSGNLPAPPPIDASVDGSDSGNPRDGGERADAGESADAGDSGDGG